MFGFISRVFGLGERRRNRRSYTPELSLRVGGRELETLDWSAGGFRVASWSETLGADEVIEGEVRFGSRYTGSFKAQVVRIFDDGSVSARFSDISSNVFVAMNGLIPRD